MSNYTKQISWSGKDALSDSDPEKVISGGDFDTEFSAVQTAINSKIDTGGVVASDIASNAITDAKISGMSSSKLSGALPAIDGSALTGVGKVLRVVQTTKTDTASHTGTSWSSALMSASITPTSTSNKILVMYSATMVCSDSAYTTYTSLWRDSTQIFLADAASSRGRSSGVVGRVDAYAGETLSQQYLDSPSTTSSITYTFKARSSDGSTVAYLNRGVTDRDNADYDFRGASSLTLMEIGA